MNKLKKFMRENRRINETKFAQIWQFDFIFALFLVIATVVVTYQYTTHTNPTETLDDLSSNAFYLSESLLGPGIPNNWNATNVEQIGLSSNLTLDKRKITELYKMPDTLRRLKFGVDQNVYLVITNRSQNLTFNGKDYVGAPLINARQSAIATRYAVLDGYLVTLQVMVWE